MHAGRLLIDPPARGSWNMSVDQAILESTNDSPAATLRFYFWEPATLSLGYFQRLQHRALHGSSQNCDVVRRVTGGGAILHDQELTYSLTLPRSHPMTRDNQAIYLAVHDCVIRVLSHWKINSERVMLARKQDPEPFLCFSRRSVGDVEHLGEKICGSAQRRIEKSILQHGSILLNCSKYAPELPGVNDLSGTEIGLSDLIEPLSAEISRDFSVSFQHGQLSSRELSVAGQIESQRFGSADWTEKR